MEQRKDLARLALPWEKGPEAVAATLRHWAAEAAKGRTWAGMALAARYWEAAQGIHPLETGRPSDRPAPTAPAAAVVGPADC